MLIFLIQINPSQLTFLLLKLQKKHCFAGSLTIDDQALIIKSAKGTIGSNTEYLYNVTKCLRDLGIKDPELEKLSYQTRKLSE